MKMVARILVIMLMFNFASFGFATENNLETDKWIGDPYSIQSQENPYIQRMQRFVERDIEKYKKDKSGSLAWLVWGYTAPESLKRGDEELGKIALEYMTREFNELEKTPHTSIWDISATLPILFMWTKAENVPVDSLNKWLKQYKPSVDSLYTSKKYYDELYETLMKDPSKKLEHTLLANETLQELAALQCAAVLYENAAYAELAKKMLVVIETTQNEDGAFDYYGHSGPIDAYQNFETGWLGWYYQFSRDPLAKQMLTKAAKASVDKLASGVTWSPEGAWWKFDFNAGGIMAAPEIVAGVSGDSRMRSIAEYRLGYQQDHISVYFASAFWDPTIPIMENWYEDLCRYTTNIEGPKLRSGFWNVAMPNKARAVSAITASYIPQELYARNNESFMEYANIMLYESGASLMPIFRSNSYYAIAEGQEFDKGIVVGEDFIAQGKTWFPSKTSTSHVEPINPNWKNTQIWFADDKGFAGWMVVTAQQNNSIDNIIGVIKTGNVDIELDSNKKMFTQKNLQFNVFGDAVDSIAMADDSTFIIKLKNNGNKQYKQGEQIGYGLASSPIYNEQAVVDLLSSDKVYEISVKRGETLECVIAYNPTEEKQTYSHSAAKATYYKSTADPSQAEKGEWSGSIPLEKNELVVVFKKREEIKMLDKASDTVVGKAKQYETILNPFSDLDNHWAKQDVLDMVSIGAVKGKSDSTFIPDDEVTRAEFLSMVLRVLNITKDEYDGAFQDVMADAWYANDIQTGYNLKLLHPAMYLDGNFNPDKAITRQEACAIAIVAFETHMGKKLPTAQATYIDENSIAPWCMEYVNRAHATNIVKGFEDGTFGARKTISRAEATVIIKRLFELL